MRQQRFRKRQERYGRERTARGRSTDESQCRDSRGRKRNRFWIWNLDLVCHLGMPPGGRRWNCLKDPTPTVLCSMSQTYEGTCEGFKWSGRYHASLCIQSVTDWSMDLFLNRWSSTGTSSSMEWRAAVRST